MKIIDTIQGTDEWKIARLSRLTASDMTPVITSTGKLSTSKAAIAHIDKMIAGRILAGRLGNGELEMDNFEKHVADFTGESFRGNVHTDRGNEMEDEALDYLGRCVDIEFLKVGMVTTDDGLVSCSPDGVEYGHLGDFRCGAEVKCPTLATLYRYAVDGGLPDQYKIQVHASMVICEVQSWWFLAYFDGMTPCPVLVQADEFTKRVAESLAQFPSVYHERRDEILRKTKI